MKFLTYEEVIIGMMKDHGITMRQALADDLYGVKNVRAYLKGYKLKDSQIAFYLDVFNGIEPDKVLT